MSFPADAEHEIVYDKTKKKLGQGSSGIVYEGKYQGINVAVKWIPMYLVDLREEDALRKLDHPNVVKLLCIEQETDFK